MLTVAAATYAVSGVAGAFDRELLGVFDALMVVVLGLVLLRDVRARAVPAGRADGPRPTAPSRAPSCST